MILIQSLLPPATLGILVLAILLVVGGFALFVKYNSRGGHVNKSSSAATTVDDYVALHGEPQDMFVLDVTRSNELDAVVLVYEHEIVLEGIPLECDKITNVTFYNAQNPYMEKEYRLVINTTTTERSSIEIPMGSDVQHAEDITTQLAKLLQLE